MNTITVKGEITMKKIIALMLVLVVMLSLNSCFLFDSDDDDGEKKATTESTTKPSINPPASSIARGEVSFKTYTSDTLNLKFTRPNSWVYATDEEIAMLMGFTSDWFDDERFEAALQNNLSIYDMMVVDKITNSNVIVGYENLKMTLSTNITEEQYLDALKRQLSTMQGITVTFPDKSEKVKLGDAEFTRVICNTVTNGVRMQQIYYVHKLNGYMGFVIVTINDDYSVADIEAMFK